MSILTLEAATFRTTEEILSLVRRFEDCTLPREEWTHAAHVTLTLFWLRAVRAFLDAERNEARALVHLANELTATHDKGLPLEHYTRARLFSPEARAAWVEPDLKPLD